jgi:hypothetical protein
METDDLSEEVMEVDNIPEEGQTAGKEKRRNVLHPFKILLALVTYKTGENILLKLYCTYM